MAIFEGSRYTNTYVYNTDKEQYFGIRKLYEFDLENSTTHIVVQGDTLSNLAYRYYKNTQYWWVLLDANKEKVLGVFDALKPGTPLIIPSLDNVIRVVNK